VLLFCVWKVLDLIIGIETEGSIVVFLHPYRKVLFMLLKDQNRIISINTLQNLSFTVIITFDAIEPVCRAPLNKIRNKHSHCWSDNCKGMHNTVTLVTASADGFSLM